MKLGYRRLLTKLRSLKKTTERVLASQKLGGSKLEVRRSGLYIDGKFERELTEREKLDLSRGFDNIGQAMNQVFTAIDLKDKKNG